MKNQGMGNKEDRTELMRSAPVKKAILSMAIPVVCGMMVSVFYNLVDTYFIGRLGDQSQLTAASISTPVFMIMMAISSIVGTGAASYISRCLGQGDRDSAERTLSTGVVLCIGLGVIVMLVGLCNLPALVTGLGASAEVFPYAKDYCQVMFWGTLPVMLSYAGGQLLRSEGAVMPSIIGMLIGTVVNIVLDPVYIFVLDMGVRGAAIATILGNIAAMGYYIFYYYSGKSLVRLSLRRFSLEKVIWKQTFFIGIPSALSQFLMSMATILLNNLAKPFGDTLLAGMGVSSKLMYIGTFVFMGFAAGCQPLVGFNYGAQNFSRVREIIRTGAKITVLIGAALTAIFAIFAGNLVGTFTPLPDVVTAGAGVLRVHMWAFLVLGPQMLCTTSIQAFGKAKAALVLSVARQGLFYVPLMLLLRALAGVRGLLFALPIADALTLCLGILLLFRILKKELISKND